MLNTCEQRSVVQGLGLPATQAVLVCSIWRYPQRVALQKLLVTSHQSISAGRKKVPLAGLPVACQGTSPYPTAPTPALALALS